MLFVAVLGSRQLLPVCYDELDALIDMQGLDPRECYQRSNLKDTNVDPFIVLDLPTFEIAVAIASRSVLIKTFIELWTQNACTTLHEAVESLAAYTPALSDEVVHGTWRANVYAYRASLSIAEMAGVRQHFIPLLPFKGSVKLKDSECRTTMWIMLDFADPDKFPSVLATPGAAPKDAVTASLPRAAEPLAPGFSADTLPPVKSVRSYVHIVDNPQLCAGSGCCETTETSLDTAVTAKPPSSKRPRKQPHETRGHPPLRRVFVGREVCVTSRHLVSDLVLQKRPFLGPTSLDAELALLMTNLARVRSYDLVYDPFVGTGSIMVAAQMLTRCAGMGSDIDTRILRGREGKSIYTNYQHYNAGVPELLRLDNAMPAMRKGPKYDAIVTDPPYGVRAGARKSGVPADKFAPIPEEYRDQHMPRTQVYQEEDVIFDLLNRAAESLVLGGHLVYLYPALADHKPEHLPLHPCLTLISDGEEPLTPILSRRIVCMRKTVAYEESKREEYRAAYLEQAATAGVRGVSIKHRLGAAYDDWFAEHKTDYDPKALLLKMYGTRADVEKPLGVEAEKAVEALEQEMAERTVSKKAVKLHRKRLLRQLYRNGEISKPGSNIAEPEPTTSTDGADACASAKLE